MIEVRAITMRSAEEHREQVDDQVLGREPRRDGEIPAQHVGREQEERSDSEQIRQTRPLFLQPQPSVRPVSAKHGENRGHENLQVQESATSCACTRGRTPRALPCPPRVLFRRGNPAPAQVP